MKVSYKEVAIYIVLLLVMSIRPAHAYLDPSTGSYVLQIMAAALFGGLFVIKTWWKRIKSFVLALISRKDDTSSEKHSDKDN